jgi:hypothetical protein
MGLLNNGAEDKDNSPKWDMGEGTGASCLAKPVIDYTNTPFKLDEWKREHDLFVTQADILRLEEKFKNFEIKLDLLLYYFREQLGEKTK